MKLFVPREVEQGESRVAMTPTSAQRLVGLGVEVILESGLGLASGHLDAEYVEAGATIAVDALAAWFACENHPKRPSRIFPKAVFM